MPSGSELPPRGGDPAAKGAGSERLAALSALVEKLSHEVEVLEGSSRRDAVKRGIEQAVKAPTRQTDLPAAPVANPADRSPVDRRTEPRGRRLDDRQAERLSGIESRLAAITEKMTASQSAPVRASAKPAERPAAARQGAALAGLQLGSLQAAIAEISARQRTLDADQGRNQSNLDALAIEDALVGLRGEIAAIGRRMATETRRAQEVPVQRPAIDEATLVTLRQDLADIRQGIELAARETTLNTIESGYGHIIERLDDIVRRTPERDRLDRIADEITRLGASFERAQPSRAVESELEDIRNALASLATPRVDPGIEREIADLRQAVDRLGSRPRETVDLSRIEQSLSGLRREFDSFATGVDLSGVTRLEHDVAGMRQAISSFEMPQSALDSTALSRLEDRLDALAGRFDALAELPTLRAPISIESLEPIRAEIGQLRNELLSREPISLDAIERQLRAMAERLDVANSRDESPRFQEIESQIDRLRRELIAHEPAGFEAIEQQMQGLVERFDAMSGRDDDRAFRDVGARIDALHRDLMAHEPAGIEAIGQQMRALVTRFDQADSRDDDRAMRDVGSQIDRLRQELIDHEPAGIGAIEQQMRALVQHLDRATSHDDSDTLKQLETQIAALADRFSAAEPVPDAIAKVEANLDRLQSLIGGAQQETAELARDAARSVVNEFAGSMSRTDEALVAALREDLRMLQSAAARSEQQTQDTLETVHDTLAKVVGRIAQLETEEQALPVSRAATKPRSRQVDPALPYATEDHRPLAPGSGKPDLSTFREQAGVAPAAERKADFIAAARRAAQAAQSEQSKITTETKDADAESQKSGTFAKLGQALRSRRRPIVLAIAAIVLAIGAMHFSNSVVDGVSRLTKSATSDPVITGSVAPIVPAKSADAALVAPRHDATAAMAFVPAKPTDNKFAAAPDAPSAMSFAPASTLTPADTILGSSSLLTAAGKGDPSAEFELGRRLAEGDGMKQDQALAANWYERAAKAGLAIAQYRIGSLYERGEGVKRDTTVAQAWYEKASLKGNAQAVHNLAVLISEGANGQPDYPRAVKLFQQAALLGIADSQYNLGVLYARGLGVSVDLVQSYKWFALAAGQGDADAAKRRDEVAKVMTPDALASARAAVKGFRPAPLDEAANTEPKARPEWQQANGKVSDPKWSDGFNG